MFDLGWMELLVIGIVALIVVGPKDLPGMFRTVGRFMGKARSMAREFQRTMESAADESGLKEATKGLQSIADPMKSARSSVKDLKNTVMGDDDKKKLAESWSNPDAEKTGAAAAETAEASAAAVEAATKAAEAAAAKKT